MDFDSIILVCKSVLTSRNTLIITIAIILYINLVTYVCHYRKKVKIAKPKKVATTKASPKKPEPAESEGEEENLKEEKWSDDNSEDK